MSAVRLVLSILGLCALSQHAAAMRIKPPTQRSLTSANQTIQALFCSSLCVPCEDGHRTVFISRSKGLLKTVIDLAMAPVAVIGGAIFNPLLYWFAPGYLLAEKAFAGSLGNECPDMQVIYFEDGAVRRVEDATLRSLMTKDDYLTRFLKNMDKLYLFDYVKERTGNAPTTWDSVKNSFFPVRKQGQLPEIELSYLKHAELFCGMHGEAIKDNLVLEESFLEGFQSKIPFVNYKPFFDKCQWGANMR